MKKIIFVVTNDLNFDQRMQRICSCLAQNGYNVLLIGRKLKKSKPLQNQSFQQKRISCFFEKGVLFYVEYNLTLFFYLLFEKPDIVCAIDLDTILPILFVSKVKSITRVYDAHELFTEQKEIKSRPFIYTIWKWVERFAVPKFKKGYTVNHFIKNEFEKLYGIKYSVIRNVPQHYKLPTITLQTDKYFIYQGAVNEGRGFENLIPAIKMVNAQLKICGIGNYFEKAKELAIKHQVTDKIIFEGAILPENLRVISTNAYAGIMIFEKYGLNQIQSLANRFFDYIMAGIPQVCINFSEYKKINDQYNIALMIDDIKEGTIATAMNKLLTDTVLYSTLKANCLKAREELNWNFEQQELITFYKTIE